MSNTEENYLDNLLKAVSEPDEAAPAKEEHAEASIEDKLGASLGIPEDVIPEVTDVKKYRRMNRLFWKMNRKKQL